MLKTSNTELAKSKKGVDGVDDGCKNRAELVSKHEFDGVDDGDSCSGDFDKKFHLKL